MDCSYIVRIFQVVRLKFSSLFYICGNRYRHQVPTYRWEKCKELIFVGLHKSAISIYMLDIRQIFCFYNILYPLNSTYHHLSGSNLLRILPTIISCVVRQQCLSQVARLRYLVVAQALLFISSLTSLQELFNVVTTNNKQPMITSTDTKTFTKSRRTQTQKSKRLHVRVGVAIRDSGVR